MTLAANILGAEGANLGALYRNGVIALGIAGGAEPLVRLIPMNGVQNALSRPPTTPISPRGALPEEEDDALIIPSLIEDN